MKALMPNVYQYIDVKVGDLIKIKREYVPHIRHFGEYHIVTWVPEDYVGRTRMHYPRQNDWITVFSPKQGRDWTVQFNEYEKVSKSS